MKLQELGAPRKTQQIAAIFESQTGKKIKFDHLARNQARGMLQRVNGLLREYRQSKKLHSSEKDLGYLKLMMMEQALTARLNELGTTPVAIDMNDPKTKATLDKAGRGQTLTPDEQKTVNAVALMKKEARKPKRMVKEQNDLHQAQVVLAAQDMIDRIQGMLEDISEMQYKDLPALVASIKSDVGVEQAQQFQNDATTALTSLLQTMQQGKTEMEAAQGVLTGQAPVVPGEDAALDVGAETMPEPAAGGDEELDLSLDANLDDEDAAAGSEEDLGRARR